MRRVARWSCGASCVMSWDETGADIGITGLLGTYAHPQRVIAYIDGEVRQIQH